jgi:hypothetical protein
MKVRPDRLFDVWTAQRCRIRGKIVRPVAVDDLVHGGRLGAFVEMMLSDPVPFALAFV